MESKRHWHVPSLDGLRGIAVLIVILCHAPSDLRLRGGNIGVDLFFVLSGFLITSILLNEWRESGRISIPHFYLRRVCRLLPASFSVLLFATIVAPWIQPSAELQGAGKDALAVILYVFNWRLVDLYEAGVGDFHNHMLSHYWSLSVEEQFYLIWPAFLLVLLRLRVPKPAMLAMFAVGIIAPAIGRAMIWKHGPSLEIYFRSDLRIDGLVWGATIAFLSHHNMLPQGPKLRRCAGLAGFTALGLFIYLSKFEMLSTGEDYRWGFALVGALASIMISSTVIAPDSFFSKCLSLRWLRYTGKISYGMYLWHIPIFIILGHAAITSEWSKLAISALLVLGIPSLSFRYLETPFLLLKARFGYARTQRMRLAPINP